MRRSGVHSTLDRFAARTTGRPHAKPDILPDRGASPAHDLANP
jgi:hypothetical protein